MNKKTKLLLAAIAVILLVGVSMFTYTSMQDSNKKTTVINNKKTIVIHVKTPKNEYYLEAKNDAATLKELLESEKDLKAELKDGPYGAYLESLMGEAQDMDKGPWWIYSSENNEDCVKQGMCPAVEKVNLKDKDSFTFSLTSDIG